MQLRKHMEMHTDLIHFKHCTCLVRVLAVMTKAEVTSVGDSRTHTHTREISHLRGNILPARYIHLDSGL